MFTSFDTIIIVIMLVTSIIGFYKGIVYIAIKSICFCGTILSTIHLHPYLTLFFIKNYSINHFFNSVISIAITYILSLVFLTFLASKVTYLLQSIRYSLVDRLLGLIAGTIKGLVISLVLFSGIVIFNTNKYPTIDTNRIIKFNFKIEQCPTYITHSTAAKFLDIIIQNITLYSNQELVQLLL